jgi:hypothetical protein
MLLKAVEKPLGTAKPLGNAQRLLGSLWEILKGCRKAAGKCPNIRRQPIGDRISQRLLVKMWQYPFISLKGRFSVHIY